MFRNLVARMDGRYEADPVEHLRFVLQAGINTSPSEQAALARYYTAILDGFSDAEAREKGWPTP